MSPLIYQVAQLERNQTVIINIQFRPHGIVWFRRYNHLALLSLVGFDIWWFFLIDYLLRAYGFSVPLFPREVQARLYLSDIVQGNDSVIFCFKNTRLQWTIKCSINEINIYTFAQMKSMVEWWLLEMKICFICLIDVQNLILSPFTCSAENLFVDCYRSCARMNDCRGENISGTFDLILPECAEHLWLNHEEKAASLRIEKTTE